MTNEELWKVFTDKNPKLLGDPNTPITLRLRGLRKMFDTAHACGQIHVREIIAKKSAAVLDDLPEFMRDWF